MPHRAIVGKIDLECARIRSNRVFSCMDETSDVSVTVKALVCLVCGAPAAITAAAIARAAHRLQLALK